MKRLHLAVFYIGLALGAYLMILSWPDNGQTVERRIYTEGEYEVFYGTRCEALDYAVKNGADSVVHVYKTK